MPGGSVPHNMRERSATNPARSGTEDVLTYPEFRLQRYGNVAVGKHHFFILPFSIATEAVHIYYKPKSNQSVRCTPAETLAPSINCRSTKYFPRGVPFEIKGRKSHRVTNELFTAAPESTSRLCRRCQTKRRAPSKSTSSKRVLPMRVCAAYVLHLRLPAWTIFGGTALYGSVLPGY